MNSQNTAKEKSSTGIALPTPEAEVARRYAESIVGTIREPLLVMDANLKIILANRNFYKIFKVTPAETLGTFIYDLGNKQWNIAKLRQLLEEVLPEKEAFDDFEVEHNFESIGHKVMLLNARQIYWKDIGTKMILLAIEDITERKQLEILLLDSEQRYRRLFETASDGIVLLEKQNGTIIQANPATEKLLGYTEKESLGQKLQDIGVSLDRDDFQMTMKNLNETGIINYRNIKVQTKSGQNIDTEIYLVDRAKLAQCNIRDITERKRAQRKLQESEEKYRLLFDSAGDAIFIHNMQAQILAVNPLACESLGYTHAELMSMKVSQLDSPAEALHVRDRIAGLLEIGHLSFETVHQRKDGSLVPIDVVARLITWDGQPAIMSICRDITRRKFEEQKLQDTIESLHNSFVAIVQVLISTMAARDPYTAGHQRRVADLAGAIAIEMELPGEKIDAVRMAGAIHDIGKLSIPAEILSKPTKLTNLEFSLIKEHSRQGYEMLKDLESPWPLAQIVYQHHERMDGSGYPGNLHGDDILVEARILAVADVVEAMASHRPYRPALGIAAALEEIEKGKGTQYDETVACACLRLFREKDFQFKNPFA